MNRTKVVYTDNIYKDIDIENRCFSKAGFNFVVCQQHDEATLVEACKDADAVMVSFADMNKNIINAMQKCKVIVRCGIGVNNVDISAASKKGIMVANVQKYCIDEVSDHAMALMLTLIRKTAYMSKLISDGQWNGALARPIPRIKGLTLGLYGLGAISSCFATKAKVLGMKIVAYDPYVKDEHFEKLGVERISDEKELFKMADILSVHLPLMESTKRIINAEKLSLMRKTSYFINVARGALVDEQALITVLQEGKIAGAGLDVLTDEYPSTDNPLLHMDNVIVTPHIAYYSDGSDKDLRNLACSQVIDSIKKGKPEFLLNGEDLEALSK